MDKSKRDQAEGIATAKAQGKHLGRPKLVVNMDTFKEVYNEWKEGNLSGVQAYTKAKMKKTSFYKMVKIFEEAKNNEK